MKKLLILMAFVLCACAPSVSKANSSKIPILAPKTATATALPKFQDSIMKMDEDSFSRNFSIILNEISHRNSETGLHLSQCDLAVSDGPDSLHGIYITGNKDCAIALIREVDMVIPDSLWNDYAPKGGTFIVAATTTINGNDYPIVVIPEGEFNSEYYVRVLAHEGFHLNRIKLGLDCKDSADAECFLNEEILAYQVQFALLENFLKKQNLLESYETSTVEKYSPEGINDQNKRALEMEHELYFQNKDGKLGQFLDSIGYGK